MELGDAVDILERAHVLSSNLDRSLEHARGLMFRSFRLALIRRLCEPR
jgi:hypothetical protein